MSSLPPRVGDADPEDVFEVASETTDFETDSLGRSVNEDLPGDVDGDQELSNLGNPEDLEPERVPLRRNQQEHEVRGLETPGEAQHPSQAMIVCAGHRQGVDDSVEERSDPWEKLARAYFDVEEPRRRVLSPKRPSGFSHNKIPESIYLVANPYPNFEIYFTQCEPTWDIRTDTIFMIQRMVIFYFFPLILMSVAYIQIIKILWRSDDGSQQDGLTASCRSAQSGNTFSLNMNTSTEGQLRSRRKAAKMLVAVVVMFAFCFLPVHLLAILRLTVGLSNSEINRALSLISHWLCYANSAINPIIYNFMSSKFRQEFKAAFFQCHQVNRSERRFMRSSTYIYRYTTTNNRHSVKTKSETIPLATIK